MSSAPATSRPPRRFRPGLLLTVLCAMALGLLVSLGTWQVARLHWKLDLIARSEQGLALPPVPLPAATTDWAALDFRRVTVAGELLGDRSLAMGTRGEGGRVGAILVTPLKLADGRLLPVERGWLPAELLPPGEPPTLRERRHVELTGVLRWRGDARQAPFTPDNHPETRRWYWYDGEALVRWLDGPVLPVSLAAEGAAGAEGDLVPQTVAVAYRNDHLGYAITWYSLAVVLVIFYVLLGLKRGES
ncbi:SURF1 family protein [Geminicoccaceae bacterium 1502E]|nr:SURF1 family protein [Geminicoccaceae bacterium 1502E]